MARDYGKVSPRFWTGETGRKLRKHPEAQTLALYLITAPGSTMTGIYYLAIPTAAHETGLTIQEVSAALAILAEIDFAHYDESNELVWVPSMAAWQIDDKLVASDKRVAGVKKEILFHQNHPFVVAFWELYGEAYEMGPCPFPSAMKGLTDPMIPPTKDLTKGLGMGLTKALASQEQDQDQEQEQEIPPPARDPAAPDASVQAVVQQAVQGALSEPAGKAGDVTAGLVPVDPVRDPLTWAGLQFLWGEARVRHLGGVSHVASAGIGDGLQEALDFVREHPEMAPHVARSMDRFWANVKAGAHDRSAEIVRKAAFAFGCWRQDFGPDYEEFIGKAPKIAAKPLGVQRCAWHAKGGKGASRKPLDACPECREDRARNGGRSGEPTTPLVRATLEGRKTVTRRTDLRWLDRKPGDLLYVKETWAVAPVFDGHKPSDIPDSARVHYLADGGSAYQTGKTRVCLFMQPRFARLWLAVVSVRVERLWDITEDDAAQEGVVGADGLFWASGVTYPTARMAFRYLWESINKEPGVRWEDNPLVAVVAFKRSERPALEVR